MMALLDWDPHHFGLEDLHDYIPLVMESPISLSSLTSETSTGHLQDAVAEWGNRSKRRWTPFFSDDFPAGGVEDLLRGFWDSSIYEEDPLANLNFVAQESSTISSETKVENFNFTSIEASKTVDGEAPKLPLNLSTLQELIRIDSESELRKRKKKKKATGPVYPFAVVKPGGLEWEVTLDDINERILMRPTRPVRHPVGEFACGPCVSGYGPGLSGKAVVGLTRIHTQGKGTITIIRTRG